jgi:hypothetical protein
MSLIAAFLLETHECSGTLCSQASVEVIEGKLDCPTRRQLRLDHDF